MGILKSPHPDPMGSLPQSWSAPPTPWPPAPTVWTATSSSRSGTADHSHGTYARDSHIFTCVESGETSDADIDAMASTHNDVHAGEIETSTTLAIRPELVKMEAARASVPDFSSDYLQFSSQRSVTWYACTEKISASGVLGNPEVATAEKGHKMWEIMIRNLVELVEHLKDLSLEQIYQRRY